MRTITRFPGRMCVGSTGWLTPFLARRHIHRHPWRTLRPRPRIGANHDH